MKFKLYSIAFALLPIAAIAQPTVTDREQYGNNSLVHYLYTNDATPGTGGAGKTWNFSTLTGQSCTSDDTLTEHVIVATNGTGPYSGLVQAEIYSDSTVKYFKMNGSNLGVSFWADSTAPASTFNYAHPLTDQIFTMAYGATAIDRSTLTASDGGVPGTGVANVTLTVDAYGTLTLPNGSYNNVVRLKTVTNDTFSVATASLFSHEVMYRWYDAQHASALLTVDSTSFLISLMGNNTGDTTTYTQYLLDEMIATGIGSVSTSHVSFSAHISNTDVTIAGAFVAGSKYTAAIFNMAGQKVYDNNFDGGQVHIALPLSSNLAPGAYTIFVMEAGKPGTMNTVKAIKE